MNLREFLLELPNFNVKQIVTKLDESFTDISVVSSENKFGGK